MTLVSLSSRNQINRCLVKSQNWPSTTIKKKAKIEKSQRRIMDYQRTETNEDYLTYWEIKVAQQV